MAENEEELLMKVKEESENADLKLNIQKPRSWHLLPSLHGTQKGGKWKWWHIFFSWAPKSLWTVIETMKLRCLLFGKKAITNLDSIFEKQKHHFTDRGLCSQIYSLSFFW